eukprot:CAMPEP_0114315140 /NCGR_PEP_ID=MMETSP0059-20121206/22291_1 /TAXON_ID=36894 /ORGANISM="Pyramimonas parkeae, Strain CCMP726" /LENGTH=76 /DNA_ID=CAMNT_0001440545 /DNA_START=132 /DNA_END=360 /DNA_ORIENTATION=-
MTEASTVFFAIFAQLRGGKSGSTTASNGAASQTGTCTSGATYLLRSSDSRMGRPLRIKVPARISLASAEVQRGVAR